MRHDWEDPTFLYRLLDSLANVVLRHYYSRHVKRLGLKGDGHILDFGSGSGACSRHLARFLDPDGGRLTCVDISVPLTAIARKRMREYENVEFLTGDLLTLALPEGTFDAVHIHYVLHEIEARRRAETVAEFRRLLKRGGKLFIKEPKRSYDGIPASEIRHLMSHAGFREVCCAENKSVYAGVFVSGE